MTDWVHCIFRHGGHFFLGGQSLDNAEAFKGQLCNFWENYQVVDPDFAFFREYPKAEWDRSIPIAIHGDEGRGKARNPVMVVTVQILLPISGKKTNMQGYLISGLWVHCFILFYFAFGELLCRLKERLNDPQALLLLEAIDVHTFALRGATCSLHEGQLPAATSIADWRSEIIARAWI